MFIAIAAVSVLLLAILGYAATRPNTFEVKRKESIQAPADRIFPLVEDFHRWAEWSPYEKLDPTMKKSFSGTERGKGAIYNWAGNNKAGEGRMEIADAVPPSLLRIQLDFLKPFEGHNIAEFTLEPEGSATRITWAMSGPQPFVFKLMSIFVNMDKMLGKEFEAGLASLKAIAENQPVVSK